MHDLSVSRAHGVSGLIPVLKGLARSNRHEAWPTEDFKKDFSLGRRSLGQVVEALDSQREGDRCHHLLK